MPTPLERLQRLQNEQDEARTKAARSQAALDRVSADLTEAGKTLRDEFGVLKLSEARALLEGLKTEVDELLTDAENKLQEATA